MGARPKGEGIEGAGFFERRRQPPPLQLGSVGSAVSSPSGVRAAGGPQPPKGCPLFSALRMASPVLAVAAAENNTREGLARSMASAGARAYNGGPEAEPPVGVSWAKPP